MATLSFPLIKADGNPFSRQELETLFAYPNIPGKKERLEKTIEHWFGQTLTRDGYDDNMIKVNWKTRKVTNNWNSNACYITLNGPPARANKIYQQRMQGLLRIGLEAYGRVQDAVKPNGRWDPSGTGEWQFFLTLGVGIVNFKTLQLFHYPPARLLNPLRDSMHDPVTARCRDLLEANGIPYSDNNKKNQTRMYETRINSTPIAAPDNQGTPQSPYLNGVKPDPVSGSYIPIEYFGDFQRQMIQLYLSPHPTVKGYTIPMIVYGRTPRQQLAGMWMAPDCAAVFQMLPAASKGIGVDLNSYLKTPVLGSNHPYLFFAIAQISKKRDWNVGCGKLVPENVDKCIQVMQDDLAVTYWQTKMAVKPSLDPWKTLRDGRKYWQEKKQLLNVCALIWRQASLTYDKDDPLGNHFTFAIKKWQDAKKDIVKSGLDPVKFLKEKSKEAAKSGS